MEIDLEQAGGDLEALAERLRSQVCVVGGGIAGLLLADRLVQAGITVTLLEAGGRTRGAAWEGDPFSAELCGVPHAGTREGRVRAFGGTSLTWGGQLLSLPADAVWPLPAAELRREETNWRVPDDAAAFLEANGAEVPGLLDHLPGLTPRLSQFVPFSRRNLARWPGAGLVRRPGVTVVLHAPVTEIVLGPGRDRVSSVAVRTRAGELLQVRAQHFAVAAGTVESCRLLLASRRAGADSGGDDFGQVGRNFHDHLTVTAAVLHGAARERMLRELRPWVFSSGRQGSAAYSMKLEPTPALRQRLGLLPGMAHLTIEEPQGSGVEALRKLLHERQAASSAPGWWPRLKALPGVLRHGLRLIWEARVRHRRYVSPAATVRLQLNTAQETPSASRIGLSEVRDANGLRKAVVDWQVSSGEIEGLRRFAAYLRESLAAAEMSEGVHWEPALFAQGEEADAALRERLEDARHAMGGACMGTDPATSVVDPELRVHGVGNLWVASPAVFPDGSAQLPTLTLSALCVRLAKRLERELAR